MFSFIWFRWSLLSHRACMHPSRVLSLSHSLLAFVYTPHTLSLSICCPASLWWEGWGIIRCKWSIDSQITQTGEKTPWRCTRCYSCKIGGVMPRFMVWRMTYNVSTELLGRLAPNCCGCNSVRRHLHNASGFVMIHPHMMLALKIKDLL